MGETPGCWLCKTVGPLKNCGGRRDFHHVVPQQRIRRAYPHGAVILDHGKRPASSPPEADVTLGSILADRRNIVAVRRAHHDQLEYGHVRLLREHIPLSVWEFASAYGFVWDDRKGFVEGVSDA